jgi:PmbA protein
MDRQICQILVEDITAGITAGRVDSVRSRSILKTGVRLYDGSTVGVAGCLGEPDTGLLEARAREMLGRVPFPWPPNREVAHRSEAGEGLPGSVPVEAESFFDALSREFPDILVSGKLGFKTERRTLTGEGMDLAFLHRGFSLVLTFKHRRSNAIADGFVHREGLRWDGEQVLFEIGREFSAFLNPVDPPSSGVLSVVFPEPEVLLTQTAGDLNGLRFATGSSLLKDRRGTPVFSPDFTLLQSPTALRGSPPFDAEGTLTPPGGLPLIEHGVFVSPYTDLRVSHTYGLPLTGSAGSAYDGIPSIEAPELRVEASPLALAELLRGEPSILVSVTAGGDFTPTGGYGAPVQLAYLLDSEGTPVGRLPECSISSSVWRMFGDDFVGVSKDPVYPSSDQRALVTRMEVRFGQE